MTATYDKLLNPLELAKADTLHRLYSVVGSMPVVLLGAFARDLLFYHVHGIEVPRATMDIDTCVQMASWEDYDAMKQENGDLQRATARVVGRDIAQVVSAQTASELAELLRKEVEGGSRCPIGHELAGYHQGQFARARSILSSLRSGFDDRRFMLEGDALSEPRRKATGSDGASPSKNQGFKT